MKSTNKLKAKTLSPVWLLSHGKQHKRGKSKRPIRFLFCFLEKQTNRTYFLLVVSEESSTDKSETDFAASSAIGERASKDSDGRETVAEIEREFQGGGVWEMRGGEGLGGGEMEME